MANKKLSRIPESYFGSVSGLSVAHGPLPLINMAVGIPDGQAPKEVIETVQNTITDVANQQYTNFRGRETFKQAIIDFYRRHYNVILKEENIAIVYGTKNGLTLLPSSVIEPGEAVYLPNPGYPDYLAGVKLAEGEALELPLHAKNDYLPDFNTLDATELARAKLIYLNYPSNPLGAVATKDFFDKTIERFKGTKTKVIHDFAYAAFGFNEKHPSILESDPNFEVSAEFYSLSKSYNMSGFRVGFLVGNREIIDAMNMWQDHTQTGMWGLTQDAATTALNKGDDFLLSQRDIFLERKDYLEREMEQMGIPFHPIHGGIFVWVPVPNGYTAEAFVDYMLHTHSILITPGTPFGTRATDHFRISMARPIEELQAFIERLKKISDLWHE